MLQCHNTIFIYQYTSHKFWHCFCVLPIDSKLSFVVTMIPSAKLLSLSFYTTLFYRFVTMFLYGSGSVEIQHIWRYHVFPSSRTFPSSFPTHFESKHCQILVWNAYTLPTVASAISKLHLFSSFSAVYNLFHCNFSIWPSTCSAHGPSAVHTFWLKVEIFKRRSL